MQDAIKKLYGGYSQEDLKVLYDEDKIKNSLLYTNQLKSRIVRSLEILIENGYGLRVARINTDDIVEIVFYDDQLYFAIGKVGNIISSDHLTLDCSSIYENVVKSIPVGNIRYIKLVLDDKKLKGGLLLPISQMKSIIEGTDSSCHCHCVTDDMWNNVPVESSSNYDEANKILDCRERELYKEYVAMSKWFAVRKEAIERDRNNNDKCVCDDTKYNDATFPYKDSIDIWEGKDHPIWDFEYSPLFQCDKESYVNMYPYGSHNHSSCNCCDSCNHYIPKEEPEMKPPKGPNKDSVPYNTNSEMHYYWGPLEKECECDSPNPNMPKEESYDKPFDFHGNNSEHSSNPNYKDEKEKEESNDKPFESHDNNIGDNESKVSSGNDKVDSSTQTEDINSSSDIPFTFHNNDIGKHEEYSEHETKTQDQSSSESFGFNPDPINEK